MAYDDNQNESPLPADGKVKKISTDFLPKFFRTEANRKFLQGTLDQLITPGVAEKVSGYIGRNTAKAFTPTDNYIGDISNDRTNYQLEPATVIKDNFDNVTFYKDYNDYVNQLGVFGSNNKNHSRLNNQETYAWNPNIDYDKFVNFREYYWLPNGPTTVSVRGQSKEIVSTYTVTTSDQTDNIAYVFNDGLTVNPTIKLFKGQTYRFEINTPGHPIAFSISRTFTPGTAVLTAGSEGLRADGQFDGQLYGNNYDQGEYIILPSSGSVTFDADENVSTLYPDGITKYGEEGEVLSVVYVEKGTIEFTVPLNAPDRLYYVSKNAIDTSGLIRIYDIEENSAINIDEEVLGKKTYKSANGVEFTNGMKVKFQGEVTPAKYETNLWYIEGVGDKISLIRDKDLIIPAAYTEDKLIPFDTDKFDELPFADSKAYAETKDYITINRASKDRNPWSRYNCWYHKDVVLESEKYNGLPETLDETTRAKRPIIEFEAGLKLNNAGVFAKDDVDLVDNFTKDVFSTIEGTAGYNIDGIDLADGMRVLFTADTDVLVNGKIYKVKFITVDNIRQISLIETSDTIPQDLECVLVTQGDSFAGTSFYYKTNKWVQAQQKTKTNQQPLFEVFDANKNSFSDETFYNSTTFPGTKIFSYKQGSGTPDAELGFPLSYRAINNSGDIVFNFCLLSDTFTYQDDTELYTQRIDTGYLKKYKNLTSFEYVNGFSKIPTSSKQLVINQYNVTDLKNNNFSIEAYRKSGDLNDLKVIVYVDNVLKLKSVDYEIDRINGVAIVRFYKNLLDGQFVKIKTDSNAEKDIGYYEFPYNLERNPLNDDITEFTLGEVIDHVDTMIEDIPTFKGVYPGRSNLRDSGETDHFGKRFVKHSGPINIANYHITNKNFNIIKALRHSKNEYSRFKRSFLEKAITLGFDGPVKKHFDKILQDLNKDRVKTESFYFSDMLAYGDANRLEYTVLDSDTTIYPMTSAFTLGALSEKSVNVYLNGIQLTHGKDYTFNSDGYAVITATKFVNDIIEIYEYENTDGSFIPATPTKSGLYPKYYPELIIDDSYVQEDTLATGPFKLYGRTEQTTKSFKGKVGWFYPLYTSKEEAIAADSDSSADTGTAHMHVFEGLSQVFWMPDTQMNHATVDDLSLEEYPRGVAMIRGHDGSYIKAYKDFRDELLLELERRIFNNIKVEYDINRLDVNEFLGGEYRKSEFTRQEINSTLLSDFIQWTRGIDKDYTVNDFYNINNSFTFNFSSAKTPLGNDVPGFWRGAYLHAYGTDRPNATPWEMLGFTMKPSWWDTTYGTAPYSGDNLVLWRDLEEGRIKEPGKAEVVNGKYARPGLTNHIPVDSQGRLKSPTKSNFAQGFLTRQGSNGFKFGDVAPVESAWRRSAEYPFAVLSAYLLNKPAKVMGLGFDVSRTKKNLANQWVYTETNKPIKLSSVKMPNTYNDEVRTLTCGLVNYIYNLVSSDILTLYSEYKSDLAVLTNQIGFKVGGFTDKTKFNLILDSRSPTQQVDRDGIFVPQESFKVFTNTSSPLTMAIYSGIAIEKAANGYIVRGYNNTITHFEYYAPITGTSKVNVSVGGISETTADFKANTFYAKGTIIQEERDFYRVTEDFTSGESFTTENVARLSALPEVGGRTAEFKRDFDKSQVLKLNYGTRLSTIQEVVDFILGYNDRLKDIGFDFNEFNADTETVSNWSESCKEFMFWTTQGWAAGTLIVLSPSANQVSFTRSFSIVDNLNDPFYDYSIFKADGQPLDTDFISYNRDGNSFTLETDDTDDGVYHTALPLVQKEHVVLLENKTSFSDIIYEPKSGYRQDRLKVSGYKTDEWNGGLNLPGFLYDEAIITNWTQWKDYKIGEIVKYKQFYYVATVNISGTKSFEAKSWYQLSEKPEPELMANLDYKAGQFADFYDLDSDGFDKEQQKLAQHLVGYQKRQYLANIINDDISQYKFYRGYIADKGTMNSLSKLFESLATTNTETALDFYEEWAIQTGRYGATESEKEIRINLKQDNYTEAPQSFELVNTLPDTNFENIYRILPNEMFDKPFDYTHEPFPTKLVPSKDEVIKTGGNVNEDDVDFLAGSIAELSLGDVNAAGHGDYIWVIETGKGTWNVYQVVPANVNVVSARVRNDSLSTDGMRLIELTTDRYVDIEYDNKAPLLLQSDIIGIKNADEFKLSGMYAIEQDGIELNKITVKADITSNITDFLEQSFPVVKLRNVRVPTLDFLTRQRYNFLTKQRIWIDNLDGDWAVLENNPVFRNEQTIQNPAEWDSTSQKFGSNFTVTSDNNNLFVTASGDSNGKVHYYRRTNEKNDFSLDATIQINSDDNLLNGSASKLGESVSVSPDGEYLVVGMPEATGVKTKFKGDFDKSITYTKGDIIKYRESLWKANREILPEIAQQPFTTFDSYVNLASIADGDSTTLQLLVAGDPGLANNMVDHILVRAPKDMYLGTSPGDIVNLYWNTRSYAFPTLDSYTPFNSQIPEITATFISQSHPIIHKVDHILKVETFVTLPSVGQTVTTNTGSGTVVYVGTKDQSAVIYIKDVNGIFSISGELFIDEESFVGFYNYTDTANTNTSVDGFWYLNTGFSYSNNSVYYDTGRGLVYADVRLQTSNRSLNIYSNIQKSVGYIGAYVNLKDRASYITHLSYRGDPGGVEADQLSNKFVVRGAKEYTDVLSVGDQTEFRLYNLDNRTIDVESAGFSFNIFNKNQTVVDLWDGYIDFTFDEFDFNGNVFEPQVGDIISDVQFPNDGQGGLAITTSTTSTAEVMFYRRNFNSVRVYVKALSGDWSQLANIGKYSIQRNANASLRGAADVDRVMGTVSNVLNDIAVGTTTVGKLIVFEHSSNFPVVSNPEIVDEEYWFFNENTEQGISRLPNPPYSLNKDYRQVYNIPAETTGTAGLDDEGAVAIYRRTSEGNYIRLLVLVSEHRKANRGFGKKVKIVQKGDYYTLAISSKGLGTREDPGSIEFFRHGVKATDNFVGPYRPAEVYAIDDIVLFNDEYYKCIQVVATTISNISNSDVWENISWKSGKDQNYRGVWDNTYSYAKDSVVNYNNLLYSAKTNLAEGVAWSSSQWELVSTKIDYTGVLPNTTANAFYGEDTFDPVQNISQFSQDFDISADGDVLITTSKQELTDSTRDIAVLVYRETDDKFLLDQTIAEETTVDGFASKVSLHPAGRKIAVSKQLEDRGAIDQGSVLIYTQNSDGKFGTVVDSVKGITTPNQTLRPSQDEVSEKFGYDIDYSTDHLLISSLNGDQVIPTRFDTYEETLPANSPSDPSGLGSKYVLDINSASKDFETTFDKEFTTFKNQKMDKGVVYAYETLGTNEVESEKFVYPLTQTTFGEKILAVDNHVYIGMPQQFGDDSTSPLVADTRGAVVDFRKNKNSKAWDKIRSSVIPADVEKIKGSFLYNKRNQQIITYVDFIDPVQGKVAGIAEAEIDFKTTYDPAFYNTGELADNNVDPNQHWAEKYVGKVWWNIGNARFAHSYQGTTNFQKNNWGKQLGDSIITVYEWVESPFLPETWDGLADTDAGLKRGISGVSLHGNTKYTTRLIYDSISKQFNSLYYFWVENKRTIPVNKHRNLSIKQIASLIGDPQTQKYRYLSLFSKNKFMLVNCNDLITSDDVVLVIKYTNDSMTKQQQNTHSQYQILSKGLDTSVVNADIENKWFDSLIGFDKQKRPVPDMTIPVAGRYGVQNKPRQGMFVNKAEALKQFVERVNIVCKANLLTDEYDLSKLSLKEPLPTLISGEYDTKISNYSEIGFVSTSKVRPAKLIPVIQNGKIISVTITDSGRGYKTIPPLKLSGSGKNAEFKITIDTAGQISNVEVINQGSGYDQNTLITVRRYTVLVEADSTVFNKWSLYSWNEVENNWFRRSIQDYDVTQFWNYIDWYATGYNQFTEIDDIIEGSYLLTGLENQIGSVVKINSIGSGGWLLLEKIADEDTEDYTVNYKTIGRQNGTVQFNDKLYDYAKNTVGFDNRSFDSYFYDSIPITELRTILNTIKDQIFTGRLAVEYNELFFASLRYVLAEQISADWLFKTSFVKAKHNLGPLYQDKTFNNNNLANYESYINEVKPYKTNVREFVSNYNNIEPTNTTVSDFDLQPEYDKLSNSIVTSNASVIDGKVVSPPGSSASYPRRHWLENNSYKVTEVVIADSGSGYTYPPTIKFTSNSGSGATAKAYLAYGKVSKIEIITKGNDYITSPTVVIEGPQTNAGTPAKATAILGDGVVRSPKIISKFDRVSGTVYYTALKEEFYATASGDTTIYNLEWPMDLSSSKVKISIGKTNTTLIEQLRSKYTYKNVVDTSKTYTRQKGQVVFAEPPAVGDIIRIEYYKPLSLLTAQDRINFAYNPTSGMFGKDLSQLMTGIDYGGVQVKSFEFDQPSGWDTEGWYTDNWDTYDNTYEDQIFTSDGSSTAVILDTPLENGIMYNFYKNGVRIDDPNYDASTEITNPTAITNSIIGDGTTRLLDLEEMGVRLLDNDIFIVRKTTSDGSVLPDADSYDTALSGGDLAYKTATGIKAEDIIVDGDGFVTPTTSGGPEELVPGQVLDTLDIKVFTRDSDGQGQIYSQSYIMDSNTTYNLGVIPRTAPAVIVKVANVILDSSQYTIDWNNNNVTLNTATPGAELNIIAMAQGVQKLLDFGQGVSTAGQSDYLTTVDWQTGVSVFVSVNGVATDVEIFNSEDSGAPIAKVGIRFKTPRTVSGEKIHYSVFSDKTKVNYSQVSKDEFTADGTTKSYTLSTTPFYAKPNEHNIIVKVGNKILNPGYNIQHTIEDGNRTYKIETFQQPIGANAASDMKVFVNGVEKFTPNEWRFDIANSAIILSDETGVNGDTVELFAITDGEYRLTDNIVTLDALPNDQDKIEIMQFSNHDLLGIERINYDVVNRTLLLSEEIQQQTKYNRLTVGEIPLRKQIVDAQYAWVSVNGELLTPSVDYYVTDDRMKIQLVRRPAKSDVIDVIHFSQNISTKKFAYRQFKDMLNRTHFKRLDKEASTLREPLNSHDLIITLQSGSGDNLSEPSKGQNLPGIIFINGERIEYFTKKDDILGQLRRGTLGTGVKDIHEVGSKVYDQNISKTIPYKDMTRSQNFTGDGVATEFTLDLDALTYNEFEVFVAGKRLRKVNLESFQRVNALDSPEGDITLPPEFRYDRETQVLTLAEPPLDKTNVTVVQKTGQIWTNIGQPLGEAENSIARFLRAGSSALPE